MAKSVEYYLHGDPEGKPFTVKDLRKFMTLIADVPGTALVTAVKNSLTLTVKE